MTIEARLFDAAMDVLGVDWLDMYAVGLGLPLTTDQAVAIQRCLASFGFHPNLVRKVEYLGDIQAFAATNFFPEPVW